MSRLCIEKDGHTVTFHVEGKLEEAAVAEFGTS